MQDLIFWVLTKLESKIFSMWFFEATIKLMHMSAPYKIVTFADF